MNVRWHARRRASANGLAQRHERRSVRRLIASATAVFAVLALVVVGYSQHRASPSVDAFYDAPKTATPSQTGHAVNRPGHLLRSERFTRGIPETARAWRILYTTTRADGRDAVASAIVLLGKHAPAGRHPVLAWAHGTSGYAQACAPSLFPQPFGSGIRQELGQVIRRHWVLVATDYIGMGTQGPQPYLIGRSEGRAMLDAVRATRQLRQVSASNKTVVWGHSQGGGAALWTGQIQRAYAPDVPLVGVAAIAPTSDMPAIATRMNDVRGGTVFMAYIMTAYAAAYPDVRMDDYVSPAERKLIQAASDRCTTAGNLVLQNASSNRGGPPLLSRSPVSGPLGQRLQENTPTGVGTTPLLIAQGGRDSLILPKVQRAFAKGLCDNGQRLDYREYPGRNHSGVAKGNSPFLPQLITWTERRWAGDAAHDNCSKLTHGQPARTAAATKS